ncbi:LamG domain-containing protein [Flavobacterium pallidum]|nr:LamG domain-containing protein [Flavobacterium pallidum]
MKKIKFNLGKTGLALIAVLSMAGCQQNMDHPAMGEYPEDENPAGGPLKFFVTFDRESENPLMRAVDETRAKFPTENNFTQIDGVSGKAAQGDTDKMISYPKPNDWATTAESFTVAFWEKHNGQTKNGANPGAEHIFSIPSSNQHWSGGTMMLLFDQYGASASAAAIKFVMIDKNMADTWMTWENENSIEGVLDNQWHHFAFVYDATTSGFTMYIDGVNRGTKTWGTHGPINLDDSKITGFRIGNGPQKQNPPDQDPNWLYSNWKGGLDQFRLYNIPLSQTEVQDLFAGKK